MGESSPFAPAKLTLLMWINEERPNAVQVANRPFQGNGTSVLTWWLPRSMMGDVRRLPRSSAEGRVPVQFTLPVWKIRQENLYSFVTS